MKNIVVLCLLMFITFTFALFCESDGNNNTNPVITACTAGDIPLPNEGITEAAGIDGCPSGMTSIPGTDVCIDRWEAFIVELTSSGEKSWSPYHDPGDRDIRAKSAYGAVPQGYINQIQAARACSAAGKRLCGSSKWTLACRGSASNTYPYGNTYDENKCNVTRSRHPAVEYFETEESWIWSYLGHSCLNQLEDSLDKAGTNGDCVSEGGMYDMTGNLNEWIDDPNGTLKGGHYVDSSLNGNGCLYTTTAHATSYSDFTTGFRCCADK